MINQRFKKITQTLIVLLTYLLTFSELYATTDTWTPNPPKKIPGGDSQSDFPLMTYDANSQTILACWNDSDSVPVYSIWNGSTWSKHATPIPGGNSGDIIKATVYDPANKTIMLVWDSSSKTRYTIWNGSSWSNSPKILPGTTGSVGSLNLVYDENNQTILATWLKQGSLPFYALWNGSSWTISATLIPGANDANSDYSLSAIFDASNNTIVATWNGPSTVSYAVWNGSTWIVPTSVIPDASPRGGTISTFYNPGNQTLIAVFAELTYSIWDGTSWTSAIPIPGATRGTPAFTMSYHPGTQTMIAFWFDTDDVATYAIWDGSTWTSPSVIPGSNQGFTFSEIVSTYNPVNDTVTVCYIDLNGFPTYAIWNGYSWTVSGRKIPGAEANLDIATASILSLIYDPADGTNLVTWLNEGSALTYSTYSSFNTSPNFTGTTIKNRFLTQTDIIHKLIWKPVNDPTVVKYLLRRNGVLIYVSPASGPYYYLDHNRNKNNSDMYTLTTQDQDGNESVPLVVLF